METKFYKAYIAANRLSRPFDSVFGKTAKTAAAAIKRRHSGWRGYYVYVAEIHDNGVGPKDLDSCSSLDDFANIINASDDWERSFDHIITRNGWANESTLYGGSGICSSRNERLYFGNGDAIVVPKDDELN